MNGWHRKVRNAATAARIKEYNSPHYKRARAEAKRLVDSGQARCWRPDCRRRLDPAKPWHLGHDDHDRSIIRGPECVACNLKAAARKGAQVANGNRHRRRHAPKRLAL